MKMKLSSKKLLRYIQEETNSVLKEFKIDIGKDYLNGNNRM